MHTSAHLSLFTHVSVDVRTQNQFTFEFLTMQRKELDVASRYSVTRNVIGNGDRVSYSVKSETKQNVYVVSFTPNTLADPSCNCGYPYQWLAPCRHVYAAVIRHEDLRAVLKPDLY